MKRLLLIGIILLLGTVTLIAGAADFSYYANHSIISPQYTLSFDELTFTS